MIYQVKHIDHLQGALAGGEPLYICMYELSRQRKEIDTFNITCTSRQNNRGKIIPIYTYRII